MNGYIKQITTEDFDFHFHQPCEDTYKECDYVKIKAATGSEEITDLKQ